MRREKYPAGTSPGDMPYGVDHGGQFDATKIFADLEESRLKEVSLEARRSEIMLWLRFAGAHMSVMLGLIMLIFAGSYALRHNNDPDLTVVAVGGGVLLVYVTWSIVFILRQYEAFVAKYLR